MNRQALEYYSKKFGLVALIILAATIFIAPLLLRLMQGSPITPGAQSYQYLREGKLIAAGIIGLDPLSVSPLAPEPYILLLAAMEFVGAPWLLPPLLGILLLVLLYLLLSKVIDTSAVVILALLVLLISPGTSILATHHSPILLCLAFIVAAALCYQDHGVFASIFLWFATITFAPLGLLACVLFIVAQFRRNKTSDVIGVMSAAAAAYVWFLLWQDIPSLEQLLSPSFNANIIFELGNFAGISVFLIVMAVYGAIVHRKDQDVVIASALLLGATFFLPMLMPAATIMLSVFAALGIYHLIMTKWELDLLQSSLLVLVSCIGIFLLITAMRERTDEGPNADFAHTMITLRNEHRPGAVLTNPSYAPMIEYFSGRRATLNPQADQRLQEDLLHSRTATTVYPQLMRTNTSYVLITNEMRRELFNGSSDGLLFLVQNSERFAKIKETGESTLWYFIPQR